MHRRAAVREAIRQALGSVGATLIVGRVDPERIEDLPAVTLETGVEEVQDDEGDSVAVDPAGKWLQMRSLEVSVTCVASGPSGAASDAGLVESAVDAICLEVERALADETLSGEAYWFAYQGLEESDASGEMERPIAVRVMRYMATYRVDARDPQSLEA